VHALEVMAEAAAHEILVINDSGVRVAPDYLQRVARPFAGPAVRRHHTLADHGRAGGERAHAGSARRPRSGRVSG
jgi:hypothetical protein